MGELAILVPVKGRPHRIKPLLESAAKATPTARVVFICDQDDVEEHEAIWQAGQWDNEGAAPFAMLGTFGPLRVVAFIHSGNYAQKINEGARRTEEPFLLLGADDLDFHPGWFENAKGALGDQFDICGTNDLCNPRTMSGEHATHCLVTRSYLGLGTIDEPGKLLHEGYEHECVDDEFVQTAKHRGAFTYCADSVVEHLHPMAGKAPMDDLYAGQARRIKQGKRLLRRRERLWRAHA